MAEFRGRSVHSPSNTRSNFLANQARAESRKRFGRFVMVMAILGSFGTVAAVVIFGGH